MKHKIMKLVSSLLVFTCLSFSFPTMPAFASTAGTDAEGFAWQSDDGATCSITGYKGSSVYVSIPSSINGYAVKSIGSNAFRSKPIKSVTVPNTVTSIGGFAFYYCSSLTSIAIPNSVISIGDSAFAYCTSLPGITLPNNLNTIEKCAFQDCKAFTSLSIPDSVTSIGIYAFFECSSLRSITIPNSVASIGEGAFKDCKVLNNVTMPDSVLSIGNYVFYGCTALSNVRLSNNLTAISNFMFYRCTSLTGLAIPGNVRTIGNSAFEDCTGLTNITIPNSVSTIGYRAFIMCSSLHNVTIPNSVRTVGFNAFAHCYSFTDIIIPNSVTSLGDYAFYYCKSLTEITIPSSVSDIGFLAFDSCNSSLVMKGYSGSYAQSYAASNSIPFHELDYKSSSSAVQSVQGSSLQLVQSQTSQSAQGQSQQSQTAQNQTSGSDSLHITSSNKADPTQSISSVSVLPNAIRLAVGQKQSLSVTVLPKNMTGQVVTWSSNNENVAVVDNMGTVTAKAIGGATITARAGTKTAVCIVTVANNIVTLREDANKLSIAADKSVLNGAVKLFVTDIANTESGLNSQYTAQYSVVYCFDVKLEDKNGKGVEPASNVLVAVPLTLSMLADANRYLVIYIDNSGAAHEIQPTVSGNNLEFTANHFSRYAIVLSNKIERTDNPVSAANDSAGVVNKPIQTTSSTSQGGNVPVGLVIAAVLCAGISVGMFFFQKKRKHFHQ